MLEARTWTTCSQKASRIKVRSASSWQESEIPVWGAVERSQPRLPSEEGKGLHQRAWFRTCQMVFKSDQEPTILDLVKEITRLRSPMGTLREEPPKGASAGNRFLRDVSPPAHVQRISGQTLSTSGQRKKEAPFRPRLLCGRAPAFKAVDLIHHPFAFYPPRHVSASVDAGISPPRLAGFLQSLFHTVMRFTCRIEEVSQKVEAFLKRKIVCCPLCSMCFSECGITQWLSAHGILLT